MDASVPRADIPGQCIQICALQLHILPVSQDIRYNGMLGGQSGKGVFIRHELARLRLLGLLHQLQFSEQEISELLGGIQIQGMACGFFNSFPQAVNDGSYLDGSLLQGFRKHADAGKLHVRQHGKQGQFHGTEQFFHAAFLDLPFQDGGKLEGDIRILRRIFAHYFHGNAAGVQFPFFCSRSSNVLQFNRGILQQIFRQNVHSVLHAWSDQGMSQQCIEKGAFDMNAVGSQNLQVKFQMMPYLLCGAFQERPDRFQIRRTGDRHVPCLVRFGAKGDAQQVVHEGIQARRFRVEAPGIILFQLGCHGGTGFRRICNNVFVSEIIYRF